MEGHHHCINRLTADLDCDLIAFDDITVNVAKTDRPELVLISLGRFQTFPLNSPHGDHSSACDIAHVLVALKHLCTLTGNAPAGNSNGFYYARQIMDKGVVPRKDPFKRLLLLN